MAAPTKTHKRAVKSAAKLGHGQHIWDYVAVSHKFIPPLPKYALWGCMLCKPPKTIQVTIFTSMVVYLTSLAHAHVHAHTLTLERQGHC